MPDFPNLPAPQSHVQWPDDIVSAYNLLQTVYHRGRDLLGLDNADPLRMELLVTEIYDRMLPVLEALEKELPNESWVIQCAEALFELGSRLNVAAQTAEGREHEEVEFTVPVVDVRTGRPGRPRKWFNHQILQEALSARRKISINLLADVLKVHPSTLRRHLKLHGIYQRFSEISDLEIDTVIRELRKTQPKAGIRYVIGFFKSNHIRVPKCRIISSLKRVNPVGQLMCARASIARREYRVSRPDALWHMDGHHKLIRWGIVIHGFVDGYSRKVMGLYANTDNKAETVLKVFIRTVDRFGFPWRIRGDRGSENIEVSVCMILFRGARRGSFIWGSSTRNTRIERLWVEVGTQFARGWRAFFTRLERIHRLKPSQHGHLWLLHHLFLSDIRKDCTKFQDQWNHHPLSGLGHDQTPEDIHFLGQLRYGKYPAVSGIHTTTQEEYTGTDDEIAASITSDLTNEVPNDAVPVPQDNCPFSSTDDLAAFTSALEIIIEEGDVPSGFWLRDHEWDGDVYPTAEVIKVGRKEVNIPLPFEVWYPRAVRWAQGLKLMTIMLGV